MLRAVVMASVLVTTPITGWYHGPVSAAEPVPVARHWAFQPIRRPVVPELPAAHPVDRFITARLAPHGVGLSPPAPRQTLIRRLSLDLVGLPPPVGRVREFVADERPGAFERLLDELLASPHFGERWGRHWLDLARYADSTGYESDQPRQIWPYRDWVIEALNDDMPFDRFVTEQLAGDLLPDATLEQRIATGFHANAMLDGGVRWEAVIDRVSTTGAVFLGLTLECAQCHAHKTDPVSQREFYRLFAFFNEAVVDRLPLPGANPGYRDGTTRKPDPAAKPVPGGPASLVLKQSPRPTHVFVGGDPRQPGEKVDPGFPGFLPVRLGEHADGDPRRATRRDLADWILSPDNPLTDRVTVNRVWQRLFGRGLVETENDFGVQTPPPSHPALLDFLAVEFRRNGRRLKPLLRLIAISATYRQSSDRRDDLDSIDQRNRLLGRQNRLRLEAEVIRDVWLAAGGLLSRKLGGPSVFPPQPPGILDNRATPATWVVSSGEDRYRRGLYTWVWRLTPHPHLSLFDAPDGVTACTHRDRSNVPVQALVLLNDPTFVECARGLAAELLGDPAVDDRARIEQAFWRCLSRRPTAEEIAIVEKLLDDQRLSLAADPNARRKLAAGAGADQAAWVVVARVLLNLDEFVTRE